MRDAPDMGLHEGRGYMKGYMRDGAAGYCVYIWLSLD
jgi:hypothetical protein